MELVRELAMDGILYMPGSDIVLHTLSNPSVCSIPYLMVQESSQDGAGA